MQPAALPDGRLVVDLSHPLEPGGPVWEGDPGTEYQEFAKRESNGYRLGAWRLGEHSGTHLGAPAHFFEGGRTVDGYGPEELRWPLWLLDSEGADGSLSRLVRAEERQGRVPEGALVVLRTGWEERWPDHRRVFPPDMAADPWPGFLEEAVEWLVGERGVRALGSDAPGIDPARDVEFLAGRALARAGGVHLENLANLRLLPRTGAEVLAAPLPLAGGAGSPCRAFALLP